MIDIEILGMWIGILTGGAAILYGISYGLYYSYFFFKKFNKIYAIIEKELQPNGGSSMRDAIKRLELMAHAENSRFKTWMTFFPYPVFETNPNGYCIYVNRAYLNFTGRNLDEVVGNGWIINVHPEDREEVHESWSSAVNDKREYCLTYRFLDKDNNTRKVHVHACPSLNHEKEVIGYIGIISILDNKLMKPYCTKTNVIITGDIENE